MSISFGADVEAFLVDRNTARFVPSCGLLGGTKEEPRDIGNGFHVQEDNVTLEFNVPASDTITDFIRTLTTAREQVGAFVRRDVGDYSLSFMNAARFRTEELRSREAQTFGCMPELNALARGDAYDKPNIRSDSRWRYAGFHIHLGFSPGALDVPHWVAAAFFDALMVDFTGRTGITLLTDPVDRDGNVRRHNFYGKPGAFRTTGYGEAYPDGIEYRCLGASAMEELGLVQHCMGHIMPVFERLCADSSLASETFQQIDFSSVALREANDNNFRVFRSVRDGNRE